MKIEDIKDKSVSEINNITKEVANNENQTNKPIVKQLNLAEKLKQMVG